MMRMYDDDDSVDNNSVDDDSDDDNKDNEHVFSIS